MKPTVQLFSNLAIKTVDLMMVDFYH